VVALQEVDVHRKRTGHIDQADTIARALGMESHFNTVLRVEDREGYGDAIMSALPMTLNRAAPIPGMPRIPGVERRGALWVGVEFGGMTVHVITTHLGLSHAERHEQLDALLGEGWLGHPECQGPRILLGDFNAIPPSRAYRRLARLSALDLATLTPARRLDALLLEHELRDRLESARFRPELQAVDHQRGPQVDLPRLPERLSFTSEAQLEAWLCRLAAVPAHLEQVTANLRQGLAEGRTPPRVVVERTPEQAIQRPRVMAEVL